VALLPVLVVLALAATVGGAFALGCRAAASQEVTVATARRHGLVAAVLAPVAGLVVAVLLVVAGGDAGHGYPGTVGDALVLVPLAYAIAHTLVLLIGELTWPGPRGAVRTARLVPRRFADVAPRRLVRLLGIGTALVIALVVVGAALAGPGGRQISHRDGSFLHTAGPWPGWHYGSPITVELVVLAAVVVGTLRVVIDRPAVATPDERMEDALRRTSVHRVLRSVTAGMLLLAGGLLTATGNALGSVQALPQLGSLAIDLLGDGTALAGLVVLCLPAPRLPVEAPAVRVG
jgi:hypothetical protein